MNGHGRLPSELPERDVTDGRDAFGTSDCYVPVDAHAVILEGPRWARRHARVIAILARIARILAAIAALLTWVGCAVLLAIVVTGHAYRLVPPENSRGYRPFQLVLAALGLLVVGFITSDVISFSWRSRAVARASGARSALTREARVREQENRRAIIASTFVDGLHLPDNPDLTEDPNGFTGTGTEAPGATDPGVYSAW